MYRRVFKLKYVIKNVAVNCCLSHFFHSGENLQVKTLKRLDYKIRFPGCRRNITVHTKMDLNGEKKKLHQISLLLTQSSLSPKSKGHLWVSPFKSSRQYNDNYLSLTPLVNFTEGHPYLAAAMTMLEQQSDLNSGSQVSKKNNSSFIMPRTLLWLIRAKESSMARL